MTRQEDADSLGLVSGQLSAYDKETLDKLVGCLTKDGKKSRAQRMLVDAMHTIKENMRKAQQLQQSQQQ
jgi:ribosomal protein S7